MQVRNLRSAFLEAVLELLWRQWTTLGVFGRKGYSGPGPIDPEALIVATIWFGRYEPRLFDGTIEWWSVNGEWLSSTRIQKLQRDLPPLGRRVLAAVAETVLLQGKPAKWRRLTDATEEHEGSHPEHRESLFLLRDGMPLPQVGVPDPIFLRVGLLRPRFETRSISERVPLDRPGNLRIRLRAFFGVSSRAEIALYLLTHASCHPRLMARQTYYAFASTSNTLRQMTRSGLVSEHRSGREVEYQIDGPGWRRFFGLPRSVPWINWVPVFRALHEVWECFENIGERTVTNSIVGSELRRCARRANGMLRNSELEFAFSGDEALGSEEYATVFAKDIKKLFKALDGELHASQV